MVPRPEDKAREIIDKLLKQAGWQVEDAARVNLAAGRGIAIREFPLKSGHGFADYLLYLDGKAVGVVEAKPEGFTLTGVETQSAKYTAGLPDGLPAWQKPLPFAYQSTGVETRFTNGLDPEPRSRGVFAFHKPETLARWLEEARAFEAGKPLVTGNKFTGARRILFLVDRGNLGDQTLKEFQQYASPYNNFNFTEEYIVQRLTSNTLDTTARVCICTIQRLYSMLKGRDLPEDLEEESGDQLGRLFKKPDPIDYNPAIPIDTFDIIVTDECHRSIYNFWAQVLEYFDAYLIGLTATPSKQTFGFFKQNLVMEYNHEMAVADGVNVNYDVYRIRTQITEAGSKVEAGYSVQIQERDTRKKRWEQLDDDFEYDPNQLDRTAVTFKEKVSPKSFPAERVCPRLSSSRRVRRKQANASGRCTPAERAGHGWRPWGFERSGTRERRNTPTPKMLYKGV